VGPRPGGRSSPTSLGTWMDCITPPRTSEAPLHSALLPEYLSGFNVSSTRVRMALLCRLRPALNTGVRSLPSRHPSSTRRSLHLAPPYLLDDYIPQYHLISSVDASKKRSLAYAHLRECNLCPRLCGVNRYEKTGVCLIGAETVKVNTIAPHFGEGTQG
jgi:hypothetical protein